MSKDQWAYWRAALNGLFIDYKKGDIPSGYFKNANWAPSGKNDGKRVKVLEAVAFWRTEDGSLACWRSSQWKAPTDADAIEDLFASCSKSPISFETFMAVKDSGVWPDAVEPPAASIGDNSAGMSEDERIAAEIKDLSEQFDSWLEKIGKIETQEQADKAANYAEEFSKLEKEATAAHKTEKDPFLEGGKAVDAKWKPLAAKAGEGKSAAKSALTPFLDEQDRLRLEAEAKKRALDEEHRKAKAKAAMAGAPPPPAPKPAPVPPVRTSAGSGRKTALKTYKVTEVTDLPALAAYLATMETPPVEFIEACQKAAARLLTAGATVPGATQRDEKRAA